MRSPAGTATPQGPPVIESVADLVRLLGDPKFQDGALYYFRGQSSLDYEWQPSIYREKEWISNEDRLFREMLLRCPQEFVGLRTTFEMLVKMQHYSLPTRLLDLTANPLVALYFACTTPTQVPGMKPPDPDGRLGVFRIPRDKAKYFDSDTVSIIANVAKLPAAVAMKKYKKTGKLYFARKEYGRKLLHEVRQEKFSFNEEIDLEDLEKVICVKAKLDNPRIIRQDGAFFLFGIDRVKTKCSTKIQDYESPLSHFIVPGNKKGDLEKELDRLSICKASLFPEIDSVGTYLRANAAEIFT
jgi:hypothetical protein